MKKNQIYVTVSYKGIIIGNKISRTVSESITPQLAALDTALSLAIDNNARINDIMYNYSFELEEEPCAFMTIKDGTESAF